VKILVVHNRYRSSMPSGEDRVVDQETAALREAGCSVEIFERRSDDIAQMPLTKKAAVPVRMLWNRRAQDDLARVIADSRPDVVHVHNVYPLLGPSALLAARDLAPIVVTLHNYRPMCPTGELFRDGQPCSDCVQRVVPVDALLHRCYRNSAIATVPMVAGALIQRRVWRSAPSAYIFLSGAQQQLLQSLELPEERCFVKHNFVQPISASGQRENLVVFIGRLDERKGVPLLLEAWDRYKDSHEDHTLRLAIVGSGPLDHLVQTWARDRAEVSVLGLRNREECALAASSARAVIVPSTYAEPFGLVVAEAMAAGTPPIAPAFGAFPELIADGIDGVLFGQGDASGLASVLHRVDTDARWCEVLGQGARQTYAERFSPMVNSQQLLTIYRYAIDHPRWAGSTPRVARSQGTMS
jgi:glycosyltransferase involved in cell wall biosynthesis